MAGFDIHRLERNYAFIDAIPDELFDLVLGQISGTLEERTEAVSQLRTKLLEGQLPTPGDLPWPEPELRSALLDFLTRHDFPYFCKEQPELVDVLLADILKSLARTELERPQHIEAYFQELLEIAEERARREGEEENERDADPTLSDEELHEMREEAAEKARRISRVQLIEYLDEEWAERVAAWRQVLDVFGDLAGLLGRGLDYARGMVRSQGWAEIVRLREMMEELPQLKKLIEVLGRMQVGDDDVASVTETVFEKIRRRFEFYEEVRTPFAPMETRGVRRSNDLSRLLPAEAVNLTHPRLRTLFYARMHEHALSTYLVDGVMAQRVESVEDIEEHRQREVEKPPAKRGPIIACLDTSGSMHGTPETVAKALVLESLRVANRENRPCYLIVFSGPDQTEAWELSLERDNIAELMAFLQCSFHGGTDLTAPINEAADLLERDDWNKADILLVSDGEFAVPSSLTERLDVLREDIGLQLHGVLISGRSASAMNILCDEVHRLEGWGLSAS